MGNLSKIEIHPGLQTPVLRFSYPEAKALLVDPAHQAAMREAYENPAIIVIDNALPQETIDALRQGLLDKTRKFKDKFNEGVEREGPVKQGILDANDQMKRITQDVFGYNLPKQKDSSFRPMISADEPLHFDTYHAECGLTPLMAILNFAPDERRWHVGPHFAEMCAAHKDEVTDILKDLKPGSSASHPIRVAGVAGRGPLGDPGYVHKIEFAPNSMWYSNPKVVSHKLVYGRGAQINTWYITDPKCHCQRCLLEQAGIKTGTDGVTVDA